MWWRLPRRVFSLQKGEGNRKAMKEIVGSGEVPGILAYVGSAPAGWCAVAPRDTFPVLNNSRILKKIDETSVWSIVCFFVGKDFRDRGLTVGLLKAAAAYVKKQGGRVLEGYPHEPKKNRMPAAFAYTGLASAFKKAGFVECARRSATRPIMRLHL